MMKGQSEVGAIFIAMIFVVFIYFIAFEPDQTARNFCMTKGYRFSGQSPDSIICDTTEYPIQPINITLQKFDWNTVRNTNQVYQDNPYDDGYLAGIKKENECKYKMCWCDEYVNISGTQEKFHMRCNDVCQSGSYNQCKDMCGC